MRALLVTLIFLVAPASAAADTVAQLGRTTDVVGGAAPASTLVDVRHPISFDFEKKLEPRAELMSGAHGFAVIDMRRLGTPAGRHMQIQFYFSGGRLYGWLATRTTNGASSAPASLTAGRYRVTVASTDAVQARLTFPTLDGAVSVVPAEREPTVVAGELSASPFSPPGTVAFGADGELAQAGEIISTGRIAARESEVAERVGWCFFEGGAPPAGSAAYAPGCPGGRERSAIFTSSSDTTGLMGLYDQVPAGRHGVGWNFSHPGSTPEARGWAVWLPVRTDGAQPEWAPEVPAAPPAEPVQPRGTPSIPARAVRVRRGRVRVPLRCSAAGPCEGRVALGGRSARFALGAGRRGHVVLRAPKRRTVTVGMTWRTAGGVAQSRARLRLRR